MTVVATYGRDTKKHHRYLIDEGQDIKGSLYLPKGGEVQKEIVIRLRVGNDRDTEH